jgi:hypothetical protein
MEAGTLRPFKPPCVTLRHLLSRLTPRCAADPQIEFRDMQATYTFPVGVTTMWWYAPDEGNDFAANATTAFYTDEEHQSGGGKQQPMGFFK